MLPATELPIRPHATKHGTCGSRTATRETNEHVYRLFGFLLGSTLAGASVYYYILEEYKVSNELLTEDIYVCCHPSPQPQKNANCLLHDSILTMQQALQAAVQRIHSYVTELENKILQQQKK